MSNDRVWNDDHWCDSAVTIADAVAVLGVGASGTPIAVVPVLILSLLALWGVGSWLLLRKRSTRWIGVMLVLVILAPLGLSLFVLV